VAPEVGVLIVLLVSGIGVEAPFDKVPVQVLFSGVCRDETVPKAQVSVE